MKDSIQITIQVPPANIDEDGRYEYTRNWYYVPRVGEHVKANGSWWKVEEVNWHTPVDHEPDADQGNAPKATAAYAMVTLHVVPSEDEPPLHPVDAVKTAIGRADEPDDANEAGWRKYLNELVPADVVSTAKVWAVKNVATGTFSRPACDAEDIEYIREKYPPTRTDAVAVPLVEQAGWEGCPVCKLPLPRREQATIAAHRQPDGEWIVTHRGCDPDTGNIQRCPRPAVPGESGSGKCVLPAGHAGHHQFIDAPHEAPDA
jgi:hypothetical protein